MPLSDDAAGPRMVNRRLLWRTVHLMMPDADRVVRMAPRRHAGLCCGRGRWLRR